MLKIATAQYPITQHPTWEAWEVHVHDWIVKAAKSKAQVLVFPEYGSMELVSLFTSDIQKNLKLQVAEMSKLREKFTAFFQKQAKQHAVAILAPSIPLIEQGFDRPVNRAYFFTPDGKIDFQDKQCMTRFEDEEWGVGTGVRTQKVFEAFGVKFGVSICFDVEFPFGAYDLAKQGAQVLLAPSCTETVKGLNRVHVGARARALENQFYVVVSQVVGISPWSLAVDVNNGYAAVYSTCDNGFPDDGILAQGKLNKPEWVYCDLNIDLVDQVRRDGAVLNYKWMQKASPK